VDVVADRVKPKLAMRELALAGLALLAGVAALAVVEQTRGGAETVAQPEGSYRAIAGSSGPAAFNRRTACGSILRPETIGVAHPTLPCGARLFITYNGKTVLTQVLDRGPYVPGRQFDLTDALARYLGLRGQKQITWSYARTG
jgi:rare lipoprotein A (peptidoglycan hydrolase)